MNGEELQEIMERLDLIEFRQELLFYNTSIDRSIFEYGITRKQDRSIMDLMDEYREILASGKDVAFVVRKDALTYDTKVEYMNDYKMSREEIIRHIVKYTGEDPIICTTGKASRELFEIREQNGQPHRFDFLTVGSMGHASSIGLFNILFPLTSYLSALFIIIAFVIYSI